MKNKKSLKHYASGFLLQIIISFGVVRQKIHSFVNSVKEVEASLAEHGNSIEYNFIETCNTNNSPHNDIWSIVAGNFFKF